MAYIPVPNPTLQRLPAYLQLLKRLQREGTQTVSCNTIAQELNLNPVLVRKDLAAVSSIGGRPKIGYMLDNLIVDVEHYLGYAETCKAVLAGTGHLGSALFAYPGFTAYGVEVVAAFDQDPALIGTSVNGKPILDIAQLSDWCREHDIKLGIITVPAPSAQAVCDAMVAGGVLGIWNFAPTHLRAPSGILIQNEDMAIPLALLSKHLKKQ